MRVLLLAGGWSAEREVSLSGAVAIERALQNAGHTVQLFDPAENFDGLLVAAHQADFVFFNLHGSPGEDGLIQALLDSASIPYQGSGPGASALALHKAATKQTAHSLGVVTPRWSYQPRPVPPEWRPDFDPPYFVKPNLGGSSLDMTLVRSLGELPDALLRVFRNGGEALVEQSVEGKEVTCAVLGDEALPPILIKPAGAAEFFDYDSKYVPGCAEELCPAPLPQHVLDMICENALAVHKGLGLAGCSRSDFILRKEKLYFLEVNTLPGMTPTSLLPQAAAARGYSFEDLVGRLMELGLEDRKRR